MLFVVAMAFNGKTKRTNGNCVVCNKPLPFNGYVYRIEKCKINADRAPYDVKGTFGSAHLQCLLNSIGSPTTLLEVLRLANEGNADNP